MKEHCAAEKLDLHGLIFSQIGNCLKFFTLSKFDLFSILKGVVVDQHGRIKVYANCKLLSLSHELTILSNACSNKDDFEHLLLSLSKLDICIGNIETEFTELVPEGKSISYRHSNRKDAFCEQSICTNSLSVRASNCDVLVDRGSRCAKCVRLRNILHSRQKRKNDNIENDEKSQFNLLNSHQKFEKYDALSKQNLELNRKIYKLEETIEFLQREARKVIDRDSVNLNLDDNIVICDMIDDLQNEMLSSFEKGSFQEIFFNEQIKYNRLKDKRSMRWHPVIIRWCLFIKNKSAKAYDGMRAFLPLPSTRTLFDYTHFTESDLGFNNKVLQQLVNVSLQTNLYDQEHTTYVGLLQDEVRIKSDLVYDKHTGELIGFMNLNNVSNELNVLEQNVNGTKHDLAKYLLVLMVRGITSNLKYPIGSFATCGITADYLFPILWEGIELIEIIAGLKVLYICCDGASPNRRFFEMHDINNKTCYRTKNPFDLSRYVYFISDPPHLLKTTRNCFSNSNAHFKSRHLWSSQDHNELTQKGLRICPKLKRSHIDRNNIELTPFPA